MSWILSLSLLFLLFLGGIVTHVWLWCCILDCQTAASGHPKALARRVKVVRVLSHFSRKRARQPNSLQILDLTELILLHVDVCASIAEAFIMAGRHLPSSHPARGIVTQVARALEAGFPWNQSLNFGSDRTPHRPGEALLAILTTAQSSGASLRQCLERHVNELRRQAFAEAEEAAARLPVRMLIPLVTLVLPVILLLLGAGLVNDLLIWTEGNGSVP